MFQFTLIVAELSDSVAPVMLTKNMQSIRKLRLNGLVALNGNV